MLEFFPIFEVNPDNNEVEARYLELRFFEDGKPKTMTFDWLNVYLFVYYTANEELRQNLALRYERKTNYIPYDVSFKITPEERDAGMVKRRIELPVDELAMAVARNEAYMMLGIHAKGGKLPDPKQFMYKGRGKGGSVII